MISVRSGTCENGLVRATLHYTKGGQYNSQVLKAASLCCCSSKRKETALSSININRHFLSVWHSTSMLSPKAFVLCYSVAMLERRVLLRRPQSFYYALGKVSS